MKVLIRLYPADWRERHGAELEGLLKQHPMTPRDVLDLIRGAMDARLRARRHATRETDRGPTMTSNHGGWLDWISALVAVLIVLFAPRYMTGFGLTAVLFLCLAVFGMWVRRGTVRTTWSGASKLEVRSRSYPAGTAGASGWFLVLGALLLLVWVVLSQVGVLNVEHSFVWLIVSLNLPYGLAVLALIQFWRQARRAGCASPTGEAALLFSGCAYLTVLLTSALLIGPLPGGSLVLPASHRAARRALPPPTGSRLPHWGRCPPHPSVA